LHIKDSLKARWNPIQPLRLGSGVSGWPKARRGEPKARSTLEVLAQCTYGSSAREILDVYTADRPGGPVLVYMAVIGALAAKTTTVTSRRRSKRGATVVLVEYDLVPRVGYGYCPPNPELRSPGVTETSYATAATRRSSTSPATPQAAISPLWLWLTIGTKRLTESHQRRRRHFGVYDPTW
jgi:hypothetical protein